MPFVGRLGQFRALLKFRAAGGLPHVVKAARLPRSHHSALLRAPPYNATAFSFSKVAATPADEKGCELNERQNRRVQMPSQVGLQSVSFVGLPCGKVCSALTFVTATVS